MSNIMQEKFIASMLLHAFGDTVGYNNGDWEFNHKKRNVTVEYSDNLLFEFIELGGINQINFKGWRVSDDTVMHLDTAKILSSDYKTMDDYGTKLAKQYVNSFEELKKRDIGGTTEEKLIQLKKGTPWNKIGYNTFSGGNGAAMRTPCIGLLYHGVENRTKLMALSIETSRITHNATLGFLGGLGAALLTAYAIEGIHPKKWPFKLLKFIESGKIEKYLEKTRGLDEYTRDKDFFIDMWKKYIYLRFRREEFLKLPHMKIPSQRSWFFFSNFMKKEEMIQPRMIGATGGDVLILAYDALMDSMIGDNDICWEKFIIYSAVHVGDGDSISCIGSAWYGAYFGLKNVPTNNLKYIEFKKNILDLADKLYSKFKKQTVKSSSKTSKSS